jgi:broad-specificity NMP kinase
MYAVCRECGAWDDQREVRPAEGDWAVAFCAACGAGFRFRQLPLFVVTGPSGAGKTAVCHALLHELPECVVLESDILWGEIEASAEDDYRSYWRSWLRLVANVQQAGRPVLLGGTVVPSQLENLPERRYLGPIHYLALVCDDDALAARLRARPAWRESGSDDFVARMVAFNRWLKHNAAGTAPPMQLLDTSDQTRAETATVVREWVRDRPAPAES